MLIAQSLRKTNICEYLLYMWQLEDLIRALHFDMALIEKNIINQSGFSDNLQKKQVYDWYESLIDMMKSENINEKGHLQINKNIIIELTDFHLRLLDSGKAPAYNAKFFHVLPLINQLRMKSSANLNDIELCFNFQYGMLLLKMKNATITPETRETQTEIARFMILMTKNYLDYQNGLLDLE